MSRSSSRQRETGASVEVSWGATLLADLDSRHPGARANMLAALANVRPSHLLDPKLWSALGIHNAADDDQDANDLLESRNLVRT